MLNLIYFCIHHGRHVNDSNASQSLEFTLLDHLPTSDGYPPHYLSICRLRATPHSVSIYIGLFTLHYMEDSSNLTTTKKTERIQAEIYSKISNLDAFPCFHREMALIHAFLMPYSTTSPAHIGFRLASPLSGTTVFLRLLMGFTLAAAVVRHCPNHCSKSRRHS